jgi:hypothetical protein
MKAMACAFLVATLVLVATPSWGKSETIKLEITGPGLDRPLYITDRDILERFTIWVAVSSARKMAARNPDQPLKTYADYVRGEVTQPEGLRMYTVTFHQGNGMGEPLSGWHGTYVVTYGRDPSSGQGYIYVPGGKDGEVFQRNVFSISTGAEGKWFHSSKAWEQRVAPLIQQGATLR